jgi:hypothetical protein
MLNTTWHLPVLPSSGIRCQITSLAADRTSESGTASQHLVGKNLRQMSVAISRSEGSGARIHDGL